MCFFIFIILLHLANNFFFFGKRKPRVSQPCEISRKQYHFLCNILYLCLFPCLSNYSKKNDCGEAFFVSKYAFDLRNYYRKMLEALQSSLLYLEGNNVPLQLPFGMKFRHSHFSFHFLFLRFPPLFLQVNNAGIIATQLLKGVHLN